MPPAFISEQVKLMKENLRDVEDQGLDELRHREGDLQRLKDELRTSNGTVHYSHLLFITSSRL